MKITMKMRRRPIRDSHRSLKEPVTGERKNPSNGDNVKTNDIIDCLTPISNNIGDEKAVIAE